MTMDARLRAARRNRIGPGVQYRTTPDAALASPALARDAARTTVIRKSKRTGNRKRKNDEVFVNRAPPPGAPTLSTPTPGFHDIAAQFVEGSLTREGLQEGIASGAVPLPGAGTQALAVRNLPATQGIRGLAQRMLPTTVAQTFAGPAGGGFWRNFARFAGGTGIAGAAEALGDVAMGGDPFAFEFEPFSAEGRRDMTMMPAVGSSLPNTSVIVKVWDTAPGPGVTGGGAYPVFAKLVDGRIAVYQLDGTIKTYRPKKHIVIPTNPRLSQVRKLDNAHKRVTKLMKRMVPAPRRRS